MKGVEETLVHIIWYDRNGTLSKIMVKNLRVRLVAVGFESCHWCNHKTQVGTGYWSYLKLAWSVQMKATVACLVGIQIKIKKHTLLEYGIVISTPRIRAAQKSLWCGWVRVHLLISFVKNCITCTVSVITVATTLFQILLALLGHI